MHAVHDATLGSEEDGIEEVNVLDELDVLYDAANGRGLLAVVEPNKPVDIPGVEGMIAGPEVVLLAHDGHEPFTASGQQSNRGYAGRRAASRFLQRTWLRTRGYPCEVQSMSDRPFPVVTVQNLRATRAFYEQLRFSQAYQFPPDGELGFVTLERGNSQNCTRRARRSSPSPKTSGGRASRSNQRSPVETWSTWALPLTSSFGSALATRGAGGSSPARVPFCESVFRHLEGPPALAVATLGHGCRCCSKARRRPLETVETVCSAQTVSDRGRPAEETESRPLTPAVLPAIARDRTAALLRVADQGGSDVERSENLHATLEHTAMIAERTVAESHRHTGSAYSRES